MTISDKLREVIDWSGINQKELAKRTGIAHSTLNGYLCGRRAIPTDAIDKIADALNINRWVIYNNEALPITKEELTVKDIDLLKIVRSLPEEEALMVTRFAAYLLKLYREQYKLRNFDGMTTNHKPE